ncbi:MAG: hypothetical protein LBJ86_06355 [Spirochaetaceae bacterium]|jgi:hypothetical protein|nr:hypothetical protein [Spirochaetaceae bacterium]
MIKGSGSEKQLLYQKKIAPFEANIKELLKKESQILAECRADPATAAPKLFFLAECMLDTMSNYLTLNGISQAALNKKDEVSLGEARKSVSKAIIYLENVVTGKVDAPFSEYEERLAELASVDSAQRYGLVRKLGLSVSLLKAAYADNTKWHWVFVDMEGHCATIAKNLLDLKKAQSNNDPSAPDYEPLLYHANFVKKMLGEIAERIHSRYMQNTQKEDLLKSCNFLAALQRIHMIFNERDEAARIKKKYDNWISAQGSGTKKPIETR